MMLFESRIDAPEIEGVGLLRLLVSLNEERETDHVDDMTEAAEEAGNPTFGFDCVGVRVGVGSMPRPPVVNWNPVPIGDLNLFSKSAGVSRHFVN